MARGARDKMYIVLAFLVFVGCVEFCHVRMFWIAGLRVTLRTGFMRVETHRRSFLEMASCAVQSLVHRALQITAIIRP